MKQKVQIIVHPPDWKYCNCKGVKRGTKSDKKCRFCKEYKQRGQDTTYACLLYDEPLASRAGNVEKCLSCMGARAMFEGLDISKQMQQEQEEDVTTDKALAKVLKSSIAEALRKQQKLADSFIKEGIPADMAYKVAFKQTMEEWS